ncbi:hypothetical protein DL769_001065 [Monosporascus sp. CRB-8-3]|nr:hypothetical protein DL769_001065 [Monosporascus sp. CRB-8-3]
MGFMDKLGVVIPRAFFTLKDFLVLLIWLALLYLLLLGVYRLYLTPSAKFPGPKLAALTFWYEFYYDVWQEGQYTWKIRDLHRKYALTVDIISRVCFGASYDCLENKDFAREWHAGMVSSSRMSHMLRQFPWIHEVLNRFPKIGPAVAREGASADRERQMKLKQNIADVVDRRNRGEKPSDGAFTIFDSMLDADVPASEKSFSRLISEAQTLTGAGAMTTANALDTTFYHLLANPNCLNRLRGELVSSIPDPVAIPSVAQLETLPYLTAVIHEGLRLSKGVPHRFARVSPDVPYQYDGITIPHGVPVGMSFVDFLENPDIFPDPDTFDPERWIPFDAPHVRQRRKSLVAFGGGTRMCLGINLAWAELYLTVAVVARRLGDRMKLHEVVFERDVKVTVDGFNALTSRESKGLRVTIGAKTEV